MSLQLKTVRTQADIVLDGVKVDIEKHDNAFQRVTLTDSKGNMVVIAHVGYQMNILVPKTEKKTVHVLAGTVPTLGAPIREEFENQFDADERKNKLERDGVIENAAIAIEEVDIPF